MDGRRERAPQWICNVYVCLERAGEHWACGAVCAVHRDRRRVAAVAAARLVGGAPCAGGCDASAALRLAGGGAAGATQRMALSGRGQRAIPCVSAPQGIGPAARRTSHPVHGRPARSAPRLGPGRRACALSPCQFLCSGSSVLRAIMVAFCARSWSPPELPRSGDEAGIIGDDYRWRCITSAATLGSGSAARTRAGSGHQRPLRVVSPLEVLCLEVSAA
jgi:hypothetical protein